MLLDELPWSNTCAISWASLPVVPQVKTFFTENVFFWLLPFSSKLSLFSAHVSAEMFKCGRIGRHRNAFLFNNNGKSLKFWPIIKKRSDSTEGIFFCFLLVFLFMVVLFYFYFYLLPCFPAFAFRLKTKVETIQERVVFFNTINFKPEQKQETQEVSQES